MFKQPGRNPGRARRVFLAANGGGPWNCYAGDGVVLTIGRDTRDGNIHHLDHDVANDSPGNLVMMHADCHRRLHGPPTPEQRQRISKKLKGRRSPTEGMKFPNHWTKSTDKEKLQRHLSSINPNPRIDVNGENNPFFGKKHTAEQLSKMRQPRQRVTCDECKQEWSINWLHRHKQDGRCLPAQSIVISGVRRTPGKLPKTICVDCGKPYARRWMERHKKEGKCTTS